MEVEKRVGEGGGENAAGYNDRAGGRGGATILFVKSVSCATARTWRGRDDVETIGLENYRERYFGIYICARARGFTVRNRGFY